MAEESGSRDHQIRDALNVLLSQTCRVVMVTGKPGYGKTTFVLQLTQCLRSVLAQQCRLRLVEALVTCQHVQTWTDFIDSLVTSFGLHQTRQCNPDVDVIDHVTRWPELFPSTSLALLLTHCEAPMSSDLDLWKRMLAYLGRLLDAAPWLCVIMTSHVEFAMREGYVTHVVRLKPLSAQETLRWLRRECPRVSSLLLFKLAHACQGRPGVIDAVIHRLRDVTMENDVNNNCDVEGPRDIRNEVSNQRASHGVTHDDVTEGFATPGDILRVLSSSTDPRERIDVTLRHLLKSLTPHLAASVITFGQFGGPVCFTTAVRVLRHRSLAEFKLQTLRPLEQRHLVDVDWKQGQITLDSFVTALLSEHGGMACFPTVNTGQLLVRCTMGKMLQSLERPLVKKSRGRVVDYRFHDYERLVELIKIAINSDTPYRDVVQVLQEEEGGVLLRCCGVRALELLTYVINSAQTQGTPYQRHFLNGLLATAMTEAQGDKMDEASELLRQSLASLEREEGHRHGYALMLFRRQLAWTEIRRGNNVEAQSLLLQAATTPVPPHLEDRARLQRLQIASHRAIVSVFLDRGQEAMDILESSWPVASSLQPHHPILAVMLNTMGMKYEREGNYEEALKFYQESLSRRREFAEENPGYLVVSLSNNANLLVQRGQYNTAVELLKEALAVRRRLNWNDYNTSLTLYYLGNAHALAGHYQEATATLREAESLMVRVAPAHSALTHMRCVLAHVLLACDKLQEAREVLDSAITTGKRKRMDMVRDQGFLHVLQLRYLVATSGSAVEPVQQSQEIRSEVVQELMRLLKVWREVRDEGVESTLSRLQESLESWTERTPAPLSLLSTDGCSLCRQRRLSSSSGQGRSSGCAANTLSPRHRSTTETLRPPPIRLGPGSPCCPEQGQVGRSHKQAKNCGREQDPCRNGGCPCDPRLQRVDLGPRGGQQQTGRVCKDKDCNPTRCRVGDGEHTFDSGLLFGPGREKTAAGAGRVSSRESLSYCDCMIEDSFLREGFPELTESRNFDDFSKETVPACQNRELQPASGNTSQHTRVRCGVHGDELKHTTGNVRITEQNPLKMTRKSVSGDSENTHLVGKGDDCYHQGIIMEIPRKNGVPSMRQPSARCKVLPSQNASLRRNGCVGVNVYEMDDKGVRQSEFSKTENTSCHCQQNYSHASPRGSDPSSPDQHASSSNRLRDPQPSSQTCRAAKTYSYDLNGNKASKVAEADENTNKPHRCIGEVHVSSQVRRDMAGVENPFGGAGKAQAPFLPSGSSVELTSSLSLFEETWDDDLCPSDDDNRSSLHTRLCEEALLTLEASPPQRRTPTTAERSLRPTEEATAVNPVGQSCSSGHMVSGVGDGVVVQDPSVQVQESPPLMNGIHETDSPIRCAVLSVAKGTENCVRLSNCGVNDLRPADDEEERDGKTKLLNPSIESLAVNEGDGCGSESLRSKSRTGTDGHTSIQAQTSCKTFVKNPLSSNAAGRTAADGGNPDTDAAPSSLTSGGGEDVGFNKQAAACVPTADVSSGGDHCGSETGGVETLLEGVVTGENVNTTATTCSQFCFSSNGNVDSGQNGRDNACLAESKEDGDTSLEEQPVGLMDVEFHTEHFPRDGSSEQKNSGRSEAMWNSSSLTVETVDVAKHTGNHQPIDIYPFHYDLPPVRPLIGEEPDAGRRQEETKWRLTESMYAAGERQPYNQQRQSPGKTTPEQQGVTSACKLPDRPNFSDWSHGQQQPQPFTAAFQSPSEAVLGSRAREVTSKREATLADGHDATQLPNPEVRRDWSQSVSNGRHPLRARGVDGSLAAIDVDSNMLCSRDFNSRAQISQGLESSPRDLQNEPALQRTNTDGKVSVQLGRNVCESRKTCAQTNATRGSDHTTGFNNSRSKEQSESALPDFSKLGIE